MKRGFYGGPGDGVDYHGYVFDPLELWCGERSGVVELLAYAQLHCWSVCVVRCVISHPPTHSGMVIGVRMHISVCSDVLSAVRR